MKNYILSSLMLWMISMVVFSCSPENNVEKNAVSEPLSFTVGTDANNCENLEIHCPVGAVCDENYEYRAYSFEDNDLRFYISFSPDVVDNYSLQSFRENFSYLNFSIFFPERATANSKFYYNNRTPVRVLGKPSEEGITFSMDSYEDGVLKGIITGTVTRITEAITSDAPGCQTGDIMGMCAEYHEADIPFTINYSFCIE